MQMLDAMLSVSMVATVATLLWFYKTLAIRCGIIDRPNERSLHVTPTVRGGGVVFILTWLVASGIVLMFFPIEHAIEILAAIVLVASVSFIDDVKSLSAKQRFLIQIFASGLMIHAFWPMDWLSAILMMYGALWAINHFNFMDGMDGFAAAQSIFVLLAYAILFQSLDMQADYWLSLLLSSAVAGFLLWNFPPARIFMGDVGSATLGFIIFIFACRASHVGHVSLASWVMLNGLFLFDATVTLVRRLVAGEKWYQSHKTHAYQRLYQAGFTVRQILFGQLVTNLAIGAMSWMSYCHPDSATLMVVLEILLLTTLYLAMERYTISRQEQNA